MEINEEVYNALTNFSMVITRASHDKQKGVYRWKMVASDTSEDAYSDNMSLDLFQDFINRIEINEIAPEEFRSTYWQGGMPYVSVSHYPDLEGEAVPGVVESVYIDGVQFKSTGQFSQTPLGLACYNAICKDLYTEPKPKNPVRVSIAFLDYGHIHKSNGFEFIRKSMKDVCPECSLERMNGKSSGKIYQKGQLVHLALTRVPANDRTSMEVEKSMTTRKEDAESIVGELAEEIEVKAKLVGKSDAMVIKAEEDAVVEETPKEEVEVVEEAVLEPEAAAPVVENEFSDRLDRIEKMLANFAEKEPVVEKAAPHELDVIYAAFRADYDQIKNRSIDPTEKLHLLQGSFETFAETIRSNIEVVEKQVVSDGQEADTDQLVQTLSTAIANVMQPIASKLDLLLTQQNDSVVKSTVNEYPVRRSIAPTLSMQADVQKQRAAPQIQSETPKLRAMIERNMNRSLGIQ